MSAMAVPLLLYIGILCFNASPMVEIPSDSKPDAAYGCWGAALIYAVTFVLSYGYRLKAQQETSAREMPMTQMTRFNQE